jgi:gamma-glutamyltranspeptidase/glutathione hydrolase
MLEQFGTWRLEDVLAFAIGYAEEGFPLVAGIRATIDRTEELLREWPGTRDLYLPAPEVGALFRNPALAATYRRIVDESRGGSREEEMERARRAYYEGFVADEIDRFVAAEGGLLTADDLSKWRATLEPVASLDYHGLTVCKTLPWAAGPVGLQQLALLEGFDLAELSPAELVHVVTECAKLAFADRDALYGDGDVPLETLLSPEYNAERRALVGEEASGDYRPGLGHLPTVVGAAVTPGVGEPTRGDTVHLDVVDRWGNMVSATPSGGWLHSSPVIPELGWPLGTRAQMFWLEEGLASSLRPGARPRTTLCPGLALRDGKPYLAWGTPGGDQQEQWALHVFLRHVDLGQNLQEAIDAPEFHMDHLISSFYPRGFAPRSVTVESRFGDDVVADLRRRGHDVEVAGPWTLGRVTAVAREPDGLLKAGANARGMQGYAVGR